MGILDWTPEMALAVRFEEGREEEREEVARNALAKGASVEFIHDITGLDLETINGFAIGR
jgi:predicted transposase YdaD